MSGSKALYAFAECRELDRVTQDQGLVEQQLMGQAALASLTVLENRLQDAARVLILCGPGNNGGDGYALAVWLAGRARLHKNAPAIHLFATKPPKSDAARFYQGLAESQGLNIQPADAFAEEKLSNSDLIIEALLGTGQTGAPRGEIAQLLDQLRITRTDSNESRRPALVSLDLPAGLRESEDTAFAAPGAAGETDQPPAPDEIHCYGVERLAVRWNPGLAAFSSVRTLPMGFLFASAAQPAARLLDLDFDRISIFRRRALDHKYSAGHGLLIGGSPGMEGALLMAARACFAAGGGILHALVPDARSREFLTASLPGVMFHTPESFREADIRPRAVAAGPGLTPTDLERLRPGLLTLLSRLEPESTQIVLDAGALPLIQEAAYPAALRKRTLLTPHRGEWRRLGGPSPASVEGLGAAAEWNQQQLRCHTLLKDSVSALLEPAGTVGVWSQPNAQLAGAGSGDNLVGVLTALFARRYTAGPPHPAGHVTAALGLLSRAAGSKPHARADQFADLMRKLIHMDEMGS